MRDVEIDHEATEMSIRDVTEAAHKRFAKSAAAQKAVDIIKGVCALSPTF